MADSTNFNLPFRRRREQKTDYKQRLKLLKSGKPRAVVRTSNQHTTVQLAHYSKEGDENTAQTTSKHLREFGWEQHTGNLPAAYLTGYLAAKKADEDEAILDLGLKTPKQGSREYAALKGLIDGGLNVPAGDGIFPSEGRLRGEHIEEMTGENVPEQVDKTIEKIDNEYE
jgi:large subunit ribosomal protein L18